MEMSVEVTRNHLLTGVVDATMDGRTGLEDVAEAIRERQREVFRTGNRGRWAPLDPATVRIKGNDRVLVGNGGLLDSLTKKGARGAQTVITTDRLIIGSTLVQGLMAGRGARGMPVRDPVPKVTRAELHDWSQLVLGDLVRPRR